MRRTKHLPVALPLVVLIAACAGEPAERETDVMVMPVTTSSDAALADFKRGQHAMDMGRFFDAREYLETAVEADPDFALAHLGLANIANSAAEFVASLDAAEERAASVTEAERILIEIARRGLDNDAEGQLQLAQQLVEIQPESPRAWLQLAGIQSGLNNMEAAREAMLRAAELAPDFGLAYVLLGNSYIFNEPKDFDTAAEYMSRLVELEPEEPNAHDLMGDAYRAQNDLANARDSYTRAAELAPDDALPLQQRGHVNSFLGDYDAARADYDAAIARGRGNQKASFAVYRALVSVHAGDPGAAVDELNELVAEIDGMDIPGPLGQKIFALTNAAQIALHHNMFDAAESILEQRAALQLEQAEQVGTDAAIRGARANIAYFEGVLAARKGDYRTATAKAREFMTLMEPDANPRKNEPAHDLLGLVSLLRGDHEGAIEHYEQANPNNIYTQYHLGLAHEGAGNAAAAQEIISGLAYNNFNNAGYALIRKDALEKAR
ncbi:MAG: tetratricopeptide repeat protein [Gemmatimonadales bacterium]|nr:tetratricopeptide repeat protein [Gemmatimonadales bacterium]NIN12247.1 tetratricopeptide repeat protein [Gemmatimonadales bacterium]NIQ99370.1 tetratricopeptide repeat protein [Gemmatimonadales bacterium]NIS64051.1 tetratricopeptide repeat protein [Gemmatimonadales bacterium]